KLQGELEVATQRRPAKNIDAVVNWGNDKAYFFQCDKYLRWDIATDKFEYWAPIAKEWPGLFTENIDAAVNWGNGKVYFFKGDKYMRWDIATDKFEYWAPIAKEWPGLFTDHTACRKLPPMPPRPTLPKVKPPKADPGCNKAEFLK